MARLHSPTTFMCLRHCSVYAPYECRVVRAAVCPLPADDIGHGDAEAPAAEGGVDHPATWDEWFVPGHEGPSAGEIAAVMADDVRRL